MIRLSNLFRGLFAAVIACFVPSGAALTTEAKLPPPYPALLQEACEMEELTVIMPVRIFNLANRFAEAPDPELTARLIENNLTRSGSRMGFMRRVGYVALRMMGRKEFQSIDQPALIMRGLDDPSEWVRYDAVWAADAVGLDTPAFRTKLAEMAGGLAPADYASVETFDAKQQRQRRAGLLLAKLQASDASG